MEAYSPKATVTPRERLGEVLTEPERVRIGYSQSEVISLLGALGAGIATGLLFGPVLGLVPLGWVPLLSYFWFVAMYTALVFMHENGPAVRDRFWGVILWSAGAAVMAMLALVIGYTLIRGQSVFENLNLTDWSKGNFFTTDMGLTGPLSALNEGGILHALVGTLEQITIALLISVPLSIATAVFLNEVGGRFARLVRTIVEAMTALPSVVAGLFIYASVIVLVTRQFNGFAAALSITVLMIPIMIRSADVVLRLVPGNLREAGLALGAGQWSVVRRIVLPTVRSGLTTAIILGVAHGIGETAPVLLTAGVTNNLNWNPFEGPQISLPLAALEFVKSPQDDMKARGFATAAFLLFVVLVLFVTARIIGGQEAGKVSDAQRRRLAVRSARDIPRMQRSYALHSQQMAEAAADAGTGSIELPPPDVIDISSRRALDALDTTTHTDTTDPGDER